MRARGSAYALPILLLCVTIALTAYLIAVVGNGRAGEEPGLDPSPGPAAPLAGPLRASSMETFLSDLDRAAAEPGRQDGDPHVAWSDTRGMVDTAREVLSAYRDAEGFSLVTSGYLDLRGNVWSALVRNGTGSVDVVVVREGDDGMATVRVLRLLPDRREGDG